MPQSDLSDIQLLIMDVDGVLSDGGIILHSDGTESKRFHVLDGHRIRMWHRSGRLTAILSGRESYPTTYRAEQLDITYVLQGEKEKLPAFESLLKKTCLVPEQVACIGDDLMDIPLIRRAGFGVAVADACDQLKEYADYVTQKPGGQGAVAEVIEYLLKKNGHWDTLMQQYLV